VVDHVRRSHIRANHSATHLLHEALREVLGSHVAQKGSLVTPDRLRFDFSHPKPIDDAELKQVEALANEIILQNAPVDTRLMALDEAIESGAMALFGEKYGEEVRVVSMGTALHGPKAGKAYSVELCGGTHVKRTGDIGLVRVVSEGAVAAGVRRLEALTGEAARAYLDEQDTRVREIASILKVGAGEITARVAQLLDERKRMEKELSEARKKLAMGGGASGGADQPREINGVKFLGRALDGIPAKDLKGMVDESRTALGSGIVVLISVSEDGKGSAVVGVSEDLTSRFSAVDLVRVASEALGGKGGGGRPDMAQAGGPDGSKAAEALAAIEAAIAG
jgi:alanyl-tRNA synthetase